MTDLRGRRMVMISSANEMDGYDLILIFVVVVVAAIAIFDQKGTESPTIFH